MVTYRRFDAFVKTYESLMQSVPEGSKICIIHNEDEKHESDAQYMEFFQHTPKNVHALFTGMNEGWGSSMNEGLALYSDWNEYEYVLESNNDVTYEPDWFEKSKALMQKYPKVGLLGLWRHIHHGTIHHYGDILIRDNAPAVSWLFRSADLQHFLPFPEKGSTKIAGGNGEDVDFVHKVQAMGFDIGAPAEDLSHHLDGYNLTRMGQENPAYL